jgi:hypothetical protein
VGVAKSFYAFDDAKGQRDVSAERELSRIESAAAPIIRKIEDGQRITLDEKCELALFVGLMRYRVPDFNARVALWPPGRPFRVCSSLSAA